jgi:transketolase
METQKFKTIANLLRYFSLLATSHAGSGHLTSSLSAADLMAVLYFGFLKYDFTNPQNKYNDRLIFSKGHATPLLYSLYKVAGFMTEEELLTYRSLYSPLQGHPTPQTPFVDVATGSLGMGLSYGLGMALALQKDSIDNHVYVLLGDGEMAEGSVWEALEIASHYNTNKLVGIIDVNRLAETGQTLLGHDVWSLEKRISAFGWRTMVIDGHNYKEILDAFTAATQPQEAPLMIIAKTLKGKGISFLEDQDHRHAKVLQGEEYQKAIEELNIQDNEKELVFPVANPEKVLPIQVKYSEVNINDCLSKITAMDEPIPTRRAYGMALAELAKNSPDIYAMDADLSDATFSSLVAEVKPDQFINMYIAEQNMISAATGMSKMGKIVFASTFASFLTRAYDQIRMSSLSESHIKLAGSHVGVSIGPDGPSQMGLEDIAMMRAVLNSTVLYPSDAISTAKLVQKVPEQKDIVYIRTTRKPTPLLYSSGEEFPIGKSKTLKSSDKDSCLIVAAGITVHEALSAYEILLGDNIHIRIIDSYSIKPIDEEGLKEGSVKSNNTIIVVEDHYFEGGLGDAVLNVFASTPNTRIFKMAITKRPHSGKPEELIEAHQIGSKSIVDKVKSLVTIPLE